MGDNLPLVDLGVESRVKMISLGASSTCALLIDDGLKCWGRGFYGQLGTGSGFPITGTGDGQLGQGDEIVRGGSPNTLIPNTTAINFGTGSIKITSIEIGDLHSCVLFENKKVKCFGDNEYAELAIGSTKTIGNQPSRMGENLKYAMLLPTDLPFCGYPDETTCNKDANCFWLASGKKSKCALLDCGAYKSKVLCSKDQRCMYMKVNKKKQCITFACSNYKNEKTCNADSRCNWETLTCFSVV